MALFDWLFGSKNEKKPNLNKNPNSDEMHIEITSEMLDENLYWNIIDKSLKNTKNQDEQEEFLINEISNLSAKEMIGFRLRTDKLLYDTYTSEMWCAAYIINGGCSDDGFEYFRNWLISRGKNCYYSAKQNPDNLIDELDNSNDIFDFETFAYVSNTAFKLKTGKEIYDFIDDVNFAKFSSFNSQIEFTWTEEDPESMKRICPKLFDKCWNTY